MGMIQADDKKAAFNVMIEDIVQMLGFKDQKDNVVNTKRMYWEMLEDSFSILSYDEITKLKKKLMFESSRVPNVQQIRSMIKHITQDKSSNEDAKVIPFDILNYKEVPLKEARNKLTQMLSLYYKADGVKEFVYTFDLMFRGWKEEDFELLSERLAGASKLPTSWDLIEMERWIRANRIEPRLHAIRSNKIKIWQDAPVSPIVLNRLKEIQQIMRGDMYPRLEIK